MRRGEGALGGEKDKDLTVVIRCNHKDGDFKIWTDWGFLGLLIRLALSVASALRCRRSCLGLGM